MGIGPGGEAVDYGFSPNPPPAPAPYEPMPIDEQRALLGVDAAGMLGGVGDVGDFGAPATEPAAAVAPEAQPGPSSKQLLDMAKQVYGIYQQIGGDDAASAGEGPVQREGQSDAEYTQELVTYAGIPPTSLAPDSREYFDYVRTETDRMIREVLGQDVEFLQDQTPEEISQLLAGKREEELVQLQRALFVRGQIGALSSRSTAVNPFTGETEQLEYEGRLAPSRAAYQRGLERETEQLGGMRGQDARSFMESLMGRKTDLFGMQGRQDAARLRAMLEDQDPDAWRKRRGGAAAADAMQGIGAGDLDRMLAQIGDEDAQMAALRELFGQVQ